MRLPGRRWLAGALAAVLVAGLASGVLWKLTRNPGQALRIPVSGPAGSATGLDQPFPAAGTATASASGPPFVTSIAPGGRYFLDQYGRPILVRGDSPWSLMTDLSPQDAQTWFTDRRRHGFNSAIVSLIGATENGAPHDDGTTFDGLQPFDHGDILSWREPYWQRVTNYLRMAEQNGITVFLYPIDGWTIGHSFVPQSQAQCERFGARLAGRFAALPNIVWVTGGDYFPGHATSDLAAGSDVDHCMAGAIQGLRTAGDHHLFSIQLGYNKSLSTENPYWARKVDWNFVYTYFPTYRAVLQAYAGRPVIPAVLGEANYVGENNQPDTPGTTDETLRRQVLWSLTSGATGDFMGSNDWELLPGWQTRLDSVAVTQIQRLRALFAGLDWWKLVPDTSNRLVTGGRGTQVTTDKPMDVLDNDYVTASRTPDGRLAVVYLPVPHTITVDRSQLAAGTTATWVDPASGARKSVPLTGSFTSPGLNSDRGRDWLLLLQAP